MDEYEIDGAEGLLGQGTTGCVYRARDTVLHRAVAIKFLLLPGGAAQRERFLVEARGLARLSHPNVVGIYRVGEWAGHPYLVSEFVAGISLDRLLAEGQPLPAARVHAIALDLARGLAAAHRRGVLHRDIKPANVMVAESGEAKLLDFSLAKLQGAAPAAAAEAAPAETPPPAPAGLDQTLSYGGAEAPAEAPTGLTRSGALVGTPRYMAPEAWRGEALGAAADVYSLGVVLYELCRGRPPFVGDSMAELRRAVLEGEREALVSAAPAVPRGLAVIIERCLQRQPGARFASGAELQAALEALRLAPPRRWRWLAPALLLPAAALWATWERAPQRALPDLAHPAAVPPDLAPRDLASLPPREAPPRPPEPSDLADLAAPAVRPPRLRKPPRPAEIKNTDIPIER